MALVKDGRTWMGKSTPVLSAKLKLLKEKILHAGTFPISSRQLRGWHQSETYVSHHHLQYTFCLADSASLTCAACNTTCQGGASCLDAHQKNIVNKTAYMWNVKLVRYNIPERKQTLTLTMNILMRCAIIVNK